MKAAAILIALFLAGCASGRWLSKEEDAEMRAVCEPKGGCVIIPQDQWAPIEQLLRRLGLWTDV